MRQMEEVQRVKNRNSALAQKVEYLEGQLLEYGEAQGKYGEMKNSLQELVQQNGSLRGQLEEALQDIQEKNALKLEWDEELEHI